MPVTIRLNSGSPHYKAVRMTGPPLPRDPNTGIGLGYGIAIRAIGNRARQRYKHLDTLSSLDTAPTRSRHGLNTITTRSQYDLDIISKRSQISTIVSNRVKIILSLEIESRSYIADVISRSRWEPIVIPISHFNQIYRYLIKVLKRSSFEIVLISCKNFIVGIVAGLALFSRIAIAVPIPNPSSVIMNKGTLNRELVENLCLLKNNPEKRRKADKLFVFEKIWARIMWYWHQLLLGFSRMHQIMSHDPDSTIILLPHTAPMSRDVWLETRDKVTSKLIFDP